MCPAVLAYPVPCIFTIALALSTHTPSTHYALYKPSTLDTSAQVEDCRLLLIAVSLLNVQIFPLLIETQRFTYTK